MKSPITLLLIYIANIDIDLGEQYGDLAEWYYEMESERKAYAPDDIEGQAYLAQEEIDFANAGKRFHRKEKIITFIRNYIIRPLGLTKRYNQHFGWLIPFGPLTHNKLQGN